MADTTFIPRETLIKSEWLQDINDTVYNLRTLQNFVDAAAATSGGIAIGDFYRNGSIVMVRVS